MPRFPRAAAELTRFRTGGVSPFGEGLLVPVGLSDTDFFNNGGFGTLLTENRRWVLISCWFSGLLLMDPVVLELESIESLVFFCA